MRLTIARDEAKPTRKGWTVFLTYQNPKRLGQVFPANAAEGQGCLGRVFFKTRREARAYAKDLRQHGFKGVFVGKARVTFEVWFA